MPLHVRQFRYRHDNLGYLVHGRRSAAAVDPGAAGPMAEFLAARGLELRALVNTHDHGDHTCGNRDLAGRTGAEILDRSRLVREGGLALEDGWIGVLETPGHTRDSLCLSVGRRLITGDTLFNGTVGNCFSGDLEAFHRSLRRILRLPPDTVVYAGHDYVIESMAFSARIEPENPERAKYLRRYDPNHVRSTLAEEVRVNPYLRFNAPEVVEYLRGRGLPVDTELQRWTSLMSVE